ncbi:hypothetical protein KP509_06G073300 [Ceratopteris richardii]|nr:hypothetical protein KP509_06G073300 [Ceratopteris richardii]
MPKKSAMVKTKQRRIPGRHITFAPYPTFYSFSAEMPPSPSSSPVTACNSKVCLCAPTTHPGSFRCRLHRSSSFSKTASPSTSSARREKKIS